MRTFFIFILAFYIDRNNAQNLIPNGSFEELYPNHKEKINFRDKVMHWNMNKYGFLAFYSTLSRNTFLKYGTEFNKAFVVVDYFEGKNYQGTAKETHTYLSCRLNDKVQKGKKYKLSLEYYVMELNSSYTCSGFGFVLTNNNIVHDSTLVLDLPNQLTMSEPLLITPQWENYFMEFVAKEDAQYITIGIFGKGDNLKLTPIMHNELPKKIFPYVTYRSARILIDKCELVEIKY